MTTTTYRLNSGLVERVDDGQPTGIFVAESVDVAVNPASQATFTQTYSTASATVPADTYAAVTLTAATITGGESPTEAEHNAVVADAVAVNAALAAVAADALATKKVVNKVIDVLQSAGFAT